MYCNHNTRRGRVDLVLIAGGTAIGWTMLAKRGGVSQSLRWRDTYKRQAVGVELMTPLRLWVLPPLLSACAGIHDKETTAVTVTPDLACGMNLAMDLRHPLGNPPRERLKNGDAISACQLPVRAEIEHACEVQDATLVPGVQAADADPAQDYEFPDYSVENEHCSFGKDRSVASCSFDLVAGGVPVRHVAVPLSFRFLDLSDDMAHNYYWTLWQADKSCQPA